MKWLLLVLTLPTENASTRMRVWRALKSLGAVVLRDGVYLLPDGEAQSIGLAGVADEVSRHGGTAYVLGLAQVDYPFETLFDRTEDYARIAADVDALIARTDPENKTESLREARKLRRAYAATVEIDFFPGEAQRQTAAMLEQLDRLLSSAGAEGEPTAHPGTIRTRKRDDYQGRRWATRARPWVDRLASAWLIRRHIDPKAHFLWLASPEDCPPDALGFDFDGAEFTHVGERVSFETLLASFGLENDPALMRMARVVHVLDVGGLPVPEASGLETLLAGMRAAISNDDALLEAACTSLDYFYSALKEPT